MTSNTFHLALDPSERGNGQQRKAAIPLDVNDKRQKTKRRHEGYRAGCDSGKAHKPWFPCHKVTTHQHSEGTTIHISPGWSG